MSGAGGAAGTRAVSSTHRASHCTLSGAVTSRCCMLAAIFQFWAVDRRSAQAVRTNSRRAKSSMIERRRYAMKLLRFGHRMQRAGAPHACQQNHPTSHSCELGDLFYLRAPLSPPETQIVLPLIHACRRSPIVGYMQPCLRSIMLDLAL